MLPGCRAGREGDPDPAREEETEAGDQHLVLRSPRGRVVGLSEEVTSDLGFGGRMGVFQADRQGKGILDGGDTVSRATEAWRA